MLDATCHVRAARAFDRLARDLVDSSEFTRIALDADAWPYSRADLTGDAWDTVDERLRFLVAKVRHRPDMNLS
ncbi:hypothetical protein LUX12_20485 [Streptomyces somaliensis]|uniref:hypothetical protein n=1 Tax=Streptomyces somaliensis TaxID=78355 RepID=UPI0020CC88F3|nr:hypothetical protein [Streptomyces somaliensis]MCP9946627.1 hypothetical protein [Streptomyces somaliensis]